MMAENPFAALDHHAYMLLTTFRKNGQPVATPVWFAAEGGKLYVYTGSTAGKVKRLKQPSRVTVAPCTLTGKVVGAAIEARGRVLATPEERRTADGALNRKYGWQKRILFLWYRLRGEVDADTAYLEISAVTIETGYVDKV